MIKSYRISASPNNSIEMTYENNEIVIAGEDLSIRDLGGTITDLIENQIKLLYALVKVYDNYITPFNSRVKFWKSDSDELNFILGVTITNFDNVKQGAIALPKKYDKFNVLEIDLPDVTTLHDLIKLMGEL